ncbi:leucine--tRNA ligase [Brachyspira intermedia]|uniref:leucine--tRNA ligase n=1 Tax=Brachyspira intermedia TaxID=84377 RepID=UPI002602CDA5|nr:leucine--tRNA ligase [uncultured Brachyspira sp.]
MEYNFTTIEKKWQKFWKDNQSFKTVSKPTDKKYYVLEMFPYPSGKMHMGHVSNYTIADSIARYYKLLGYDILHPMGWDAFGMPAENAAIEHKTHPAEWTLKNIANMKEQLNLLGYSYDWDREVTTCLPDYYKWGQWFILKMYEKGLLYRKGGDVNWCDHCNTVLANEQVTPEGTCWRCDGEVTKKKLEQWYIKVTDYAEQLDADLKLLEGYWPDNVIAMQKNWIGRSVGAYINFNLDDGKEFPIFTTRPDTIYGVTYMAIAWNYDGLLDMCTPEQRSAVEEFIKKSAKIDQKTDYEKEGVFTGRYVVNPFNGEKAPLYAANFVLAEYGSGAVMAVPAHDQRDFEFAKKYNIPIKVVIQNADNSLKAENMIEAYTEDGTVVNSDILNGLSSRDAIKRAIEYATEKGFGKEKVQYKLRDWLISRQRYWGNPLPFVHCEKCGVVPVPESELPITLPMDIEFTVGDNPLKKSESFVNTTCPKCGGKARRETDTMDTFTCSSWYYARYTDAHNTQMPFDPAAANAWLGVDQYIGGIEHACMHLLYSRFWYKFMRDIGLVKGDEPFNRLLTQGMVLANSYESRELKKFYTQEQMNNKEYEKDSIKKEDIIVKMEKMSKSKANGVDPAEIIELFGADAVRIFVMFVAPPEKDKEWSDEGVKGSSRFLNRIWNLFLKYKDEEAFKNGKSFDYNNLSKEGQKLFRKYNKTIKKVTIDIKDRFHFNTAIAALMELLNDMSVIKLANNDDYAMFKEVIRGYLILLNPIAPHMTEELYQILNFGKMILEESWVEHDEQYCKDDTFELVFQVNGKIRDRVEADVNISEDDAKTQALSSEKVKAFTDGKNIVKVVYVKGKLVNIVVK